MEDKIPSTPSSMLLCLVLVLMILVVSCCISLRRCPLSELTWKMTGRSFLSLLVEMICAIIVETLTLTALLNLEQTLRYNFVSLLLTIQKGILDTIKTHIPRVYVNLVSPPDVTLLGQVSSGFCSLLHAYECGCATDTPRTTHAHMAYTTELGWIFTLLLLKIYRGFGQIWEVPRQRRFLCDRATFLEGIDPPSGF